MDRLYTAGSTRRQRNNRIARFHGSSGDLTSEAAKILIGANDALHRKAEWSVLNLTAYRNRFKMFQQRGTEVPRGTPARCDDVIPFKSADWNAEQFWNFEAFCECRQIALMLCKDLFRKIDEIHFVDGRDDVTDPKQRGDKSMPPRLRENAFARIDQNDSQVCRGRAGDHVTRVLFVARRVGDDELPLCCCEEAVG